MISNRPGIAPVPTSTFSQGPAPCAACTQHFTPRRGSRNAFSHPLRHLRGIVRRARQRRTLAVAVIAGTVTGIGILATGVSAATIHHLRTAPTAPLAPPRPLSSAVPTAAQAVAAQAKAHHHNFLTDALHTNPLRGIATWYGSVLHGHKTASGERFDETELTAAHKTLPLGTIVRVTDLSTLRSVIVRINDRGTLAPGRIIDLSSAAANELGMLDRGIANVKLEVLHKPQDQS